MPDPNPQSQDKIGISPTIEGVLLDIPDKAEGFTDKDLQDGELAKIPGREKLYSRSILATFSTGMVDPFLTTIAIDMGINSGQMGWLRAITNLLGNFVQPIFGYLSDKIRRRSIFIALSNILYSSVWILLLFVNNIIMIIVMAGIISLVISLGVPAWTALLGEVVPFKIRGKIIGNVNWYSQISYILSTILGGLLLNYVMGSFSIGSRSFPLNMFLTIIIGLAAGIISAVIIFTFNEKKAQKRAKQLTVLLAKKSDEKKKELQIEVEECLVEGSIIDERDPQSIVNRTMQTICITPEPKARKALRFSKEKTKIPKQRIENKYLRMLKSKDFMKYNIIFSIQSFFMSMCWPLFPIRQRSDIGANYFEIAVFSVVMSVATVLTIRYSGEVSDLVGRKTQLFLNRLILAAMPISYMFATKVWHVILLHAVICIPLGLTSAVQQTYLIDVTPEEDRSTYVGFFNMCYGVMLFLGSLFGGYLVDFLMGNLSIGGYSPHYEQYFAITIALAVGFIGRVLTALPFLTLREVKYFPYNMKDLRKIVFKSKRLLALLSSVSFFFGITFIFMAGMGYLP
ncbi:MAG: MFS transporter [Asgard group archaeon]|nr:MFS transporter [Asgard group archaeon]